MPTLSRHVPSIVRFGKRNHRAPSLRRLPAATPEEGIERLANLWASNLRKGLGTGQIMHPAYAPRFPCVRNIAADFIAPLKRGPDNVAHLCCVALGHRAGGAEDFGSTEFVLLFNT